ncbi:MAG: lysophospholipid acyltransferase family protein [Cyclobacteriaceae bacterium]|nr:lysophospholipid acyltransferase family protein [Cyclobacteriaceae bacterium]
MNLWYRTVRLMVTWVLKAYFRDIIVQGEENVPATGAVMFTVNHQNAFLDALLIATTNKRFTHFLVRADVFKSAVARKFFSSLNMMPVYRWRDGRHGLFNNQEIFRKCSDILTNRHALMVFPEANHHQQRRLLPLSKGFTRITSGVYDVVIVPVGLNYSHHRLLGGSVTVCYGKPISPPSNSDERRYAATLVEHVSGSMRRLITHIEPSPSYQTLEDQLNQDPWQYLDPYQCNKWISTHHQDQFEVTPAPAYPGPGRRLALGVSFLLNFLPLGLCRMMLQKIGDPVFSSSIKVIVALVLFPWYYILLGSLAIYFFGLTAGIAVLFLAVVSMLWRKWTLRWITIKSERKYSDTSPIKS